MAVQKKSAPASASAGLTRSSGPSNPNASNANNASGSGHASYDPDDFVQGGLLDDIDVMFQSVRFVEWDYNGTIDTPTLALLIHMTYEDNGDVKEQDQYYSAGDLKRFQPSEDGCHAVSVGGAKGLALGTNVAALFKSLKDSGFPMEKLQEGMNTLDGLSCHINRIPQQERKGNKFAKRDNDNGFEKTVAVVTKIHKMPWETKGTKTTTAAQRPATSITAGKKATAATQEAAPPDDEDLVNEAAGILLEVLQAKGGSVKKTGLAPASFQALKGNPNRAAILALWADPQDAFLNRGNEFGWDYDDVTVSLPQE